ncbi:hypothetical protein Bca101_033418 [Brassica carinata]
MKRVMTTASMCTPHIATMRPDMNRVQMLRGEDRPAELQHKTCQRAPVIVNACYLLELIRHRQLLMECAHQAVYRTERTEPNSEEKRRSHSGEV